LIAKKPINYREKELYLRKLVEDKDKRVFSTYQILILQTLLDQNYTDYDQNKVYALQNL
jgi:hypothetical protein